MINERLADRINNMIAHGQTIKEVYDLSRPVDLFILERLAYFDYAVPFMIENELDKVSEDDMNNFIIQKYNDLKYAGRIYNPLPELP